MILKLYRKCIGSKFVIKLVIVYSFITFISVVFTANLVTSDILSEFENKELENQDRILEEMKSFTEEKYYKVRDTMLQFYSLDVGGTNLIDILKNAGSPNDLYKNTRREMEKLLRSICMSQDILDMVIIGTKGDKILYASSNQSRSVSLNYNFSNNRLIQYIRSENTSLMVFGDRRPDYILYSETGVLSFVGNIYDQDKIKNSEPVGMYILNISSNTFQQKFAEYARNKNTRLLILKTNGNVIFDSTDEYSGEEYPYYNSIKHLNGNEVMLEEMSIVNIDSIGVDQLDIISITSKKEIFNKLNEIKSKITLLLVVCLSAAVILTVVASGAFNSRIGEIGKKMKEVEKGNLNVSINVKSMDEIGILGMMFNSMCARLKQYIDRVYVAEIKTKNAEIKALQSRINPHFLCNMIEIMRMKLLKKGEKDFADMLSIIGRLFRWNVKGKGLIVRIEDEVDYTRMYLDFEKIRYGVKFKYDFDIDPQIIGMGIPKMLLQPIVENAVYHGLGPKGGEGMVTVKGYAEKDVIIVNVCDNGVGMDEASQDMILKSLDESDNSIVGKDAAGPDEYHIGLKNVYQRIKLIFGAPYGLSISSKENEGTKVEIQIPLFSKEEMERYVQTADSR